MASATVLTSWVAAKSAGVSVPVSVMTAIFCLLMGCSPLCAILLSEAFREVGWCLSSVNLLVEISI